MIHHQPVMLNEVIEALNLKPDGLYVDATLGAGGHTSEILKHGCRVIGIDQDQSAIDLVNETIDSVNLTRVLGNFADIEETLTNLKLQAVDGILFDLGASSMQFDQGERGFSFQTNAPLDMRMSDSLGVTAADLVNALSKKELANLLVSYAQEKRAWIIADHIVKARLIKPITTTRELAGIVERTYPGQKQKIHPATKTFQALRIAVNDELGNLNQALPAALESLNPGGRLVILSFHEGEDRIVKQFINKNKLEGKLEVITKKPLTPSPAEISQNRRSRSAKLRIAQKI